MIIVYWFWHTTSMLQWLATRLTSIKYAIQIDINLKKNWYQFNVYFKHWKEYVCYSKVSVNWTNWDQGGSDNQISDNNQT